jgi:hypothetical protein
MRGIRRFLVPGILVASICLVRAFCLGCLLRTPYLLKAANAAPKAEATPPPRVTAERIERIVRTHLVDGYTDPATVGTWLDTLAANPAPILALSNSDGPARQADVTPNAHANSQLGMPS